MPSPANRKQFFLLGSRGMALLLVVSVISLLTVIIIQFSHSMRSALVDAVHYQKREMLEAAVQSGIDIGCAVLVADRQRNDFDSLLDQWAIMADEPIAFPEDIDLRITLIDLDGRFPVNSLVATAGSGEATGQGGMSPDQARDTLLRLLLNGSFAIDDEIQAREIVDSLVDWLDNDDDESPLGAESSYYESLEPPYRPRNGLVESVEELLLVKGITTDLLYGTSELSDLIGYITAYGNNRLININTAPIAVIAALDERIGSEEMELIDTFRRDEAQQDRLADGDWYRTIAGWPGDILIDPQLITVQSNHFLIRSVARLHESQVRATAVVKRDGERQVELLSLRVN